LFIAVLAFAAYANSFSGRFILDDKLSIIDNKAIRALWPLSRFTSGTTRPVVELSLALNYALGGLDVPGYHVFNLTVHVAAALLLWAIVRRGLCARRFESRFASSADGLAFAVAAIWVTHPLCTQAVTYITQRAESMAAMFYLLTLYGVIRAAASPRPAFWSLGAIGACLLGMGSKAVMVTAPVAVLLYDRLFITGAWRETLVRRGWLHAALFSTIAVLYVFGVLPGLFIAPQHEAVTVGFALPTISPWQYALTQAGVILHYLRLAFWPHPLCADYGWPVARGLGDAWAAVLAVTCLLAATAWAIRRAPALGFLGLFFFLVLAPTSSFIPIKDVIFEHRMYLPLAAVIVAAVMGADAVRRKLSANHARRVRGLSLVALGAVLAALTGKTLWRNWQYANPVHLWRENVALWPNHARPHNALGYALFVAGDHEAAIASFSRALELDPFMAGAYANMGDLYFHKHQFAEAAASYGKALEISPYEFTADFHYRVAAALMELGRFDEAIATLRDAILIDPEYELAHYAIGNAYSRKGMPKAAMSAYAEALRLNPRAVRIYVNLGQSLEAQGREADAIEVYQKGITAISPTTPSDEAFKVHYNLGLVLLRAGRRDEALEVLHPAVRINPQHPGALAAMRAAQGG